MLTVQAIVLLCGVGVAPLVGLVTKSSAPRWFKSCAALVLSGAAGAITTTVYVKNERWQDYVVAVVTAFVATIAAHYGFFKPTGIAQAVQNVTGDNAIGPVDQARAV